MDVPPVTPSGALPQPVVHDVDAGRGANWWSEAWRLFTPSPGVWILIALIFIGMTLALSVIPFLGWLAVQILTPVMSGGLMLGCRAVDRGERLKVSHLFAGFSHGTSSLVVLGLIYTLVGLAFMAIIAAVLFMLFGASVMAQFFSSEDPVSMGTALGGLVLAFLIALLAFLLLFVPLMMAIWFAPALVVLRGIAPVAAMKLSFAGCVKNVLPMLIYSLIGVVLALVASIPFGLGWLVLAPLTIATVYTGYCDVFEGATVARPPAPATVSG